MRGEGSESVAKEVRYLELPEGVECDLWCGREKLAELAVCSAALLFGRHQERLPLLSDRHVTSPGSPAATANSMAQRPPSHTEISSNFQLAPSHPRVMPINEAWSLKSRYSLNGPSNLGPAQTRLSHTQKQQQSVPIPVAECPCKLTDRSLIY